MSAKKFSTEVNAPLALILVLVVGLGHFESVKANDALGLGALFGGVGDIAGRIAGMSSMGNGVGGGGLAGNIINTVPNVLSKATSMVDGITKPVFGMLGSIGTGQLGQFGGVGNVLGAASKIGDNTVSSSLNMANNAVGTSSEIASNALSGGLSPSNIFGRSDLEALNNAGGYRTSNTFNSGYGFSSGFGMPSPRSRRDVSTLDSAALAGNSAAFGATVGAGDYSNYGQAAVGLAEGMATAAGSNLAANEAAAGLAANIFPGAAAAIGTAAEPGSGSVYGHDIGAATSLAANPLLGRQILANEALKNAQAESAIAGADMMAHGANNARSASLASNAYRQAKLAGARDRVNIAGTIQNSARISDTAIATHDAATKAEDSLLGSELAVDSAATVLDSDGAYIPPVTSSLLRSLPYGRLGIRNIIPKPLTYPSVLLPDVWLNGAPVNYLNVPLRMLPYTIGPTPLTNPLWLSGAALANGQIAHGQPFIANNGMLLNSMVIDPAYAYLAAGGLNLGALGSTILPILGTGLLEAQDELALANLITLQQQGGAGMSGTYQGYGRSNPVPMITGSVSDNNLLPTTTVGTTYPIGSALVIEPRDSFFQDYVDSASSRQNYDERQQ